MRLRDKITVVLLLVITSAVSSFVSYNIGYQRARQDMAATVLSLLKQQFKQ